MSREIDSFHSEFFQDVFRDAEAGGRFAEDSFFELFCNQVMEAGELEAADRAFYQSPRGIRIDGYGGDPVSSEGTLSLIISDFSQAAEVASLTATELDALFRRLLAFLEKALDPAFVNSLEETSPGFGVADVIASSWSQVQRVRLLVISNRLLSARVKGREATEFRGVPVTYSVWDLGRLHRYADSGRAREEMVIELADYGGPLDALPAHLSDAGYEAYLVVVPGRQLAAIYGDWGSRLLEQNVRVFLQARGAVNKGIKRTLETEPAMFFAYNNGITATAEEVVSHERKGRFQITALRNFQIVNGGQTTASIYAASNNSGADLSHVFVQMKLSVIEPSQAEEVVPRISEYANSQNKVSAADFFSNHPFHVRMQTFSETTYAPLPDGSFHQTKWFYERARGQYQEARSRLSGTERKKFDLEFPKRQVITKTDLVKFVGVWEGVPDTVSKGAQKNFGYFAAQIGKAWDERSDDFNEAYFQAVVAKAIVFKHTEALVANLPWYEGGYRANIVAYAIAKLAYDVAEMGRRVNLKSVWMKQAVGPEMHEALNVAADRVREVVVYPPAGAVQNVTEWAKQPACWSMVKALRVHWPTPFLNQLLTSNEQRERDRAAKKDQRVLNGIEAQTAVINAGPDLWRQLRDWGKEQRLLSVKELDIFNLAATPDRIPSDKQSLILMKALEKLREEGCTIGAEIGR